MLRERLAGGFYFFYYASVAIVTPFFPVWLKNVGQNTSNIVLLTSLVKLTAILGPILWADFAKKTPRPYLFIGLGMALVSGMSAILPVSLSSLLFLSALTVLMGLLYHGLMPHFDSLTLVGLGENSSRYGQIRVAGSFGYAAAGIIAGPLIINGGVWSLPISSGLMFLGGALCCLPLLTLKMQLPQSLKAEKASFSIAFSKLFSDPTLTWLLSVSFLMQVSYGAYYVFYAIWLGYFGHNALTIGLLVAWGTIAEIIILAKAPTLLKIIQPKPLVVLSIAITIVRWVLIGLLPQSTLWMFVAQTCHAFSYGAFHVATMQIFAQRLAHHEQMAFQGSFNAMTFGVGGLIGTLIAGFAWSSQGGSMAFNLGALLLTFSLLWSLKHLRETKD